MTTTTTEDTGTPTAARVALLATAVDPGTATVDTETALAAVDTETALAADLVATEMAVTETDPAAEVARMRTVMRAAALASTPETVDTKAALAPAVDTPETADIPATADTPEMVVPAPETVDRALAAVVPVEWVVVPAAVEWAVVPAVVEWVEATKPVNLLRTGSSRVRFQKRYTPDVIV
jgi:hypothetical protein